MTRDLICSESLRVQPKNRKPDSDPTAGLEKHSPQKRHLGLDIGRLVAAFFVVAIHAGPGVEAPGVSGEIFNQAARFAVPFFFCVSGFLFSRSCRKDFSIRTLWRYEWRVLSLFLFWSVVFFLNPSITATTALGWGRAYSERWDNLISDPIEVLLQGTALHLWFLPSLAMGLLIVWLLNRRSPVPGVIIGVLLFLCALSAELYHPFGVSFSLGMDPRDGPFFGTVFVALGFITGWSQFSPAPKLAWICFLGGAALQAIEVIRFHIEMGASPFGFNFVFGTLFFGYGAFLLALTWHPSDRLSRLGRLGLYATGIYCVHVLFVAKADFFDVFFPQAWWGFIRTILVFLLALLSSMVLAKIPPLKRYVS